MPLVTSCCASSSILQDAYIDPNSHPVDVVSAFDSFVCDNDECDAYGSECGAEEVKEV